MGRKLGTEITLRQRLHVLDTAENLVGFPSDGRSEEFFNLLRSIPPGEYTLMVSDMLRQGEPTIKTRLEDVCPLSELPEPIPGISTFDWSAYEAKNGKITHCLGVDFPRGRIYIPAREVGQNVWIFYLNANVPEIREEGARLLTVLLVALGSVEQVATPRSGKSTPMIEKAVDAAQQVLEVPPTPPLVFEKGTSLYEVEAKVNKKGPQYYIVEYQPITAEQNIYMGIDQDQVYAIRSLLLDEDGRLKAGVQLPLVDDVLSKGATLEAMRKLVFTALIGPAPRAKTTDGTPLSPGQIVDVTPAVTLAYESKPEKVGKPPVKNTQHAIWLFVHLGELVAA